MFAEKNEPRLQYLANLFFKAREEGKRLASRGIKGRHGYEKLGHSIGCLCEGCESEVIAGAEAGDTQAERLLKTYGNQSVPTLRG